MGLFDSLFGRTDDVTRAARGSDRERFARVLASSNIYFLCIPERFAEGLPADAPQEQVLALIEDAARELATSEDFTPFSYDDGGRHRMPVFSTEQLAAEFAKWWQSRARRIIPIQYLGVPGATLVPAFVDADDVVLNDRTKHEYVLTPQDRTNLAGFRQ